MGLTISGLVGTIDWQDALSQIRQVEEEQLLSPLRDQKDRYERTLSAWDELSSKLSDFLEAVQEIDEADDFNVFTANLTSSSALVSPESIVSVNVSPEASQGRYDIQVLNLAKAEKLQSVAVSSSDSDAGWTGTIDIEGHDITLDGKSLQDLQSEINALNSGDDPTRVVASILEVSSSEYRLILTSEDEGAAGFSFTDASNDYFSTLQAGEDASLAIDGINITRSSNIITDVIPGVTLNLRGEDSDTTITLDITRDQSALNDKIQDFVDKYNDVINYINDQFNYNSENSSTGGPLFGDAVARSIKTQLESTVVDAGLYSYGITFDDDGTLELDTDSLESSFQSDFSRTVSGFNNVAQSLSSLLSSYTDSVDGTVKLQKDSLQSIVDRLDDKISGVQDRIDKEIERLTNQFIAMDKALSQLHAQSNWLSQQLSSIMPE